MLTVAPPTTSSTARAVGTGDLAVTLVTDQPEPTVRVIDDDVVHPQALDSGQSPFPNAQEPRRAAGLRCIPCDCHTTFVHSPLLHFACSLSAGYFIVLITFGLSASFLPNPPRVSTCHDFLVDPTLCVATAAAAAAGDTAVAAVDHRLPFLVALLLAFLTNNKWLRCADRPTASFRCEVAVGFLAGSMALVAFIVAWVEHSACFACELVPAMAAQPEATGLLTLLRYESLLSVVTSLFLLCGVACMAFQRVPWLVERLPLVGGLSGSLSDETASTLRHIFTSRVHASLIIGLFFNVAVTVYYGAWLTDTLKVAAALAQATTQPIGAAAGGVGSGEVDIYTKGSLLFGLLLVYLQLAVCAVASVFNGWKHLQHWRAVTAVKPRQVAPTPEGGATASAGPLDVLDAEHARLVHVGSRHLVTAAKLPAFLCSSLACGSVVIAVVASVFLTAFYMWCADDGVRILAAPALRSFGYTLAILCSGLLSRMVLVRCLFNARQKDAADGAVLPMQRPICFAWYEAYQMVYAIAEGVWIGAKRLVIAFAEATGSLLRPDRPSYTEGQLVTDKVFRSYAAVLCLERDAEANRRQAGATHLESGAARAVEPHASVKQTGIYCLKWLAALLAPLIVYAIIVSATDGGEGGGGDGGGDMGGDGGVP